MGPWVAAALCLDTWGQRSPGSGPWDAIVVAGCRVDPGGVPSVALQQRTELAVSLWEEGLAPTLVFTGGVGTFPPSEARAAADWALGLGVPEDVLILEQTSTSTEENAIFLANHHHFGRVLLVTDAYHVFRARRVFARHFREVGATGSLAPPWTRVRGSLREVLAVGLYALQGRFTILE